MSTSSSAASLPAGDHGIVQGPAALIDRAADWLMEQALGQTALADLFGGCCERLLGRGDPLSRAYIPFRVLHPLYEAMGMTWLRGSAVESASYIHRQGEQPPEPFASSPLRHMVQTQLPFLRRRLTGDEAIIDFPLLAELRDAGATDYLGYLVYFGGGPRDGIADPGPRTGRRVFARKTSGTCCGFSSDSVSPPRCESGADRVERGDCLPWAKCGSPRARWPDLTRRRGDHSRRDLVQRPARVDSMADTLPRDDYI